MQPSARTRPTRLSLRDVTAEDVFRAMREHADEIENVRDVQRLLRETPGEVVAVAIADLVALGKVVGASGTGRLRAVEPVE